MRTVIIWMFILLSVSSLMAQKAFSQKELDAVLNPVLVEHAEEMLRFERMEINAGTLSEDDKPQVFAFICTNIGTEKVVVTKITTTCGCTNAQIDSPIINPGEKAMIRLTYNPFGQPGTIYTRAFVYASISEKRPVAALTILGKVTPSAALWKDYRYTMGHLKIRAKTLNMGTVTSTMRKVERIACANAGSAPLKIGVVKGFLPEFLSLRTEPEVLEPAQEGFLIVELDGKKLSEQKGQKSFSILLDGISGRPSDRTIKISMDIK